MRRWSEAELVAPAFDETVRLASYIAGGGSAAVHLLDDGWQHRVSAVNAQVGPTPVTESMCLLVVRDNEAIYTTDATQVDRFDGNPFVTGPDPVRLYNSTPLRLDSGEAVGTLCIWDLTARPLGNEQRERLDDLAAQLSRIMTLTEVARQLTKDALHDPLTGLANRTLLADRLALAMGRRRRAKTEPVVAVLDLDGFKAINDTRGHGAGDMLLVSLAKRLSDLVREEDTVARLGGDEFVVVFDRVDAGEDLAGITRRLQSIFDEPFLLDGELVPVRGSWGAVMPQEGELAYQMLARADALMYEQKAGRR